MRLEVEAVCTGAARPFNGAELSAISKRPRDGKVQVLTEGLAPDEQADRSVHGGPEMALHLYPLDHHAFWRDRLGELALLDEPGAFGSNLAVSRLAEAEVHIGDRFRLGSALIEVSQPRQPCWKIEHRFAEHCDAKGMVKTIIETARSGWYYRVIETGWVEAGDALERVEIGESEWSVERAFAALFAGKGSAEDYAALSAMERLPPKLRDRARGRIA